MVEEGIFGKDSTCDRPSILQKKHKYDGKLDKAEAARIDEIRAGNMRKAFFDKTLCAFPDYARLDRLLERTHDDSLVTPSPARGRWTRGLL